MVGSAEICRSIAFWGVAAVLFSLFAAIGAIFVYRVYASLSKMAKRIGLASMALLGLLSIGATIGGTPTREDKERSCQENNAWANVFGFGTNGVQNMGGFLTGLTGSGGGDGSVPQSLTPQPLTLNPLPPATNYQLSTTNLGWLAFGGYEDWFYLDGGGWCFRFGSNLVERLTVFSCGEISPAPYDASNRISLLGLPLSIVPAANWHLIGDESLFCHSETPSNTLLLTWQNALVNRDTNLPVTVQAELFPDGAAAFRYDFSGIGDISALSNAEAQIWRDGVLASNYQLPTTNYQLSTTNCQLNSFFEAPPITGTNGIAEVYARIAGGNTNAYYCADVVVEKGPAKIRVEPMEDETNRGLLGAYEIVALPSETNRLPLLIGPKYTVSAETAFGSFELVPPPFVPLADDTGTVERLSFGDALTLTNLTDRLVEVQWPVEFALEEIDATPEATTYALRVTPDWLDGVVTWHGIVDTNAPPMRGAPPMRSGGDSCSCGCLLRDGLDLIHSETCSCEHCSAEGECLYEGHSEVFSKDFKGDGQGNSHGEVEAAYQDMRPEPSVSVSFDKKYVLFEAPYEDEPGCTNNPAPSTTTKLTVSAYGGGNGIFVILEMLGGIDICPGENSVGGLVPAYGMEQWEVQCKGVAASPNVEGAVAVVRYFDIGSPDSKMADARATSVEITLQPEDSINGCPNRHKVGVCETVKCLHQPSDAPVIWGKIGGGSLRMGNNNDECCYDAPVLGTSASLTATCGEEQYSTFITVIEPAGLWCSNHVTSIISNTAPYTFGGIGMNLHLYVLPFSVSFQNIAVEEVPCEVGYPTGYFTNLLFAGRWSHSVAMGAGRWIDIKPGNEFGEDKSTYGEWPTPWAPGELRWPIPVGWNVKGTKSGPQVKNFPVEYQSIKTIGADGTITQSKHEHTISKTTNGVIRLDGELINGN